MHFLSEYFRKPVTLQQTSFWSSYILRVALIILKWEQPIEIFLIVLRNQLHSLILENNSHWPISIPLSILWFDSTLKFPSLLLLKIANNVLVLIQDLLQMWLLEAGSNCGIFKQASEIGPNKLSSTSGSRCWNKNLSKIWIWTVYHFLRAKDAVYLYKSFGKWDQPA